MMDMDWIKLIAQVGVPTAVLFYVLLIINKTLEKLKDVIFTNTSVLALVLKGMDYDEEALKIIVGDNRSPAKIKQKV